MLNISRRSTFNHCLLPPNHTVVERDWVKASSLASKVILLLKEQSLKEQLLRLILLLKEQLLRPLLCVCLCVCAIGIHHVQRYSWSQI